MVVSDRVDRADLRRLREARARLVRLQRVRGPGRRTARRIARARLALAALAGSFLAEPGLARPPSFLNPLAPTGLADVGAHAAPALADLDGDGDLDALVGTSEGHLLLLANTGSTSVPAFATPESDPFGLASVGLADPALVDLDGDGDLDALVGGAFGSILYFANIGSASAPAFAAPESDPFGLESAGFDPSPALADLDGDGDLDAFVGATHFEPYGGDVGRISFSENTGSASAPAFAPSEPGAFGLLGAGFSPSPAFADLDGDGDLDALVGNQAGSTLFFANMGGANAPAFAAPVVDPFGLGDVGSYASPACGDLDGDGDLDTLVGDSGGGMLFFRNTGSAGAPAFDSTESAVAEVGSRASPTFADLDGDGDLDALVGERYGKTIFLENIGTASSPVFASPVLHAFGLADVGLNAAPDLADLDDDGDLDVFVGDALGSTVFLANTGGASAPAFAAPETNPFGLTGIGLFAAPDFADLDGDGDLDALAGNDEGDTLFFENTGRARSPAFAAPLTNPFGLGDVGSSASPAFADLDGDGDLDAFAGNAEGDTLFFENTGGARRPAFAAPLIDPFGLGDVGAYAAPAFADLDGDGDLDGLVGRSDGRVILFENLTPALCSATLQPGCTTGFGRASLVVNEHKPGKEKLDVRLAKGPALTQTDFGDPTAAGGTDVALCAYDDAGKRVAVLGVNRAGESCGSKPCWKTIGKPAPDGAGFAYKDAAAGSDGVHLLELRAGASGRSSVALEASNRKPKGQAALPTGIAAALAATTQVTLQLHTSGAACFEAVLGTVAKQESDFFKAKAP